LLEEQSGLPLSYDAAGMTQIGMTPTGFRESRGSICLGTGHGVFDEAVHALWGWEVHRAAGIEVAAPDGIADQNLCVLLLVRLAFLWVTAACRIVYVVESDTQSGFAYGTLPHHVECGEELFLVEIDTDGRVRFTIRSFSAPGHPLVALGAPVARGLQRRATGGYLKAMKGLIT
jgi:uncharacterized protein (UPF0548 family)